MSTATPTSALDDILRRMQLPEGDPGRWDDAGYHTCVFLRDRGTERISAYAVGICDGIVCLADLPGVVMTMFKTEKEGDK
jgi:hypothetical protein